MISHGSKYELPKNVEHYLATLSKVYAHEEEFQLQKIIVNSQVRIKEMTGSDSWSATGHSLYLAIPEILFLNINKNQTSITQRLRDDLNKIHNLQDEYIDNVFIELGVSYTHDWKKKSGVLLNGQISVMPDALKRIWPDEGFRVFLSHKTEVKKETAQLKTYLKLFGISCFVAHEDIKPTKEWQDEIENALESMDGFVALMTENFHTSDWTDQEVGYAFARKVPIVAVRLGKDPYGFIGKFQGVSSSWGNAYCDIPKALIKNEKMFSFYIRALKNCPNWNAGNVLSKALEGLENLDNEKLNSLIKVYNETQILRGSFGFNGAREHLHGPGILFHLNRMSHGHYVFNSGGLIGLSF